MDQIGDVPVKRSGHFTGASSGCELLKETLRTCFHLSFLVLDVI